MNNIDIYKNSSLIFLKRIPCKILSWTTILSLTFVLCITFMCTVKYKTYLKYESYIREGNIELLVDARFFEKAQSNKFLLENKNYDYDIISIMEFNYEYGESSLWKIIIDAKLPDNMMVENNYFQIRFLEIEGTAIERIINKIRRELNL